MPLLETLPRFAKLIYDINKDDRHVLLGAGGFEGTGKSCFYTLLQIEYSKLAGLPWSFKDNCTWNREELIEWIDGKSREDKSGRKPEMSAICPDELIMMFYRREWNKEGQIGAVKLLNTCRDRHLFIAGGAPDFWDLDGAVRKRFRFYVYIPERGRAWVFEQENNPFTPDQWNTKLNEKIFRKSKAPYSSPNFLFEIRFRDWTDKERKEYYEVRNNKRRLEYARAGSEPPSIARAKKQRNDLIKYVYERKVLSQKDIGEATGLSQTSVSMILSGGR